MAKVSLATYSVRLRYGSSHTPETLGRFGPNDSDLFDVLYGFLKDLKKSSSHDKRKKHVISTRNVFSGDDRTIHGRIESGVYGKGSKIRSVDNGKMAHRKTPREADMLPFYFLFDIPEMANEGFLILERQGNIGIRKDIGVAMQGSLEKSHPGYTISFHHLVREDVVDAYLNGGAVSAIRFIRFGLPKDLADIVTRGHVEEEGSVELVARLGEREVFLNREASKGVPRKKGRVG